MPKEPRRTFQAVKKPMKNKENAVEVTFTQVRVSIPLIHSYPDNLPGRLKRTLDRQDIGDPSPYMSWSPADQKCTGFYFNSKRDLVTLLRISQSTSSPITNTPRIPFNDKEPSQEECKHLFRNFQSRSMSHYGFKRVFGGSEAHVVWINTRYIFSRFMTEEELHEIQSDERSKCGKDQKHEPRTIRTIVAVPPQTTKQSYEYLPAASEYLKWSEEFWEKLD
ncbi:hypothetical protein P7C70_g5724, partial [Phenoliferia sp. Uapishka_3]